MSRQSSAQELVRGPEQKQRANIYTMMLILSFIVICVACVLLYLELEDYGPYPWWSTSGVTPAASQLIPLFEGWQATA